MEYFLSGLAILFVQSVDYLYFTSWHAGLKFPDYFPLMYAVIFLAWKYILRQPLSDLVGVRFNDWLLIKKNLCAGIKYGVIVVLMALSGCLLTSEVVYSLNTSFLINLGYLIWGYLVFVPLAAFYEELHYRGLYLKAFQPKYLRTLLVVVSGAVFTFVHLERLDNYPVYYPVNIALLGGILTLYSLRKNNLVACTGFHIAWNLCLIALSPFFGDNSERYVEFGLATVVVLILVLGYEISLLIKNNFNLWKDVNEGLVKNGVQKS